MTIKIAGMAAPEGRLLDDMTAEAPVVLEDETEAAENPVLAMAPETVTETLTTDNTTIPGGAFQEATAATLVPVAVQNAPTLYDTRKQDSRGTKPDPDFLRHVRKLSPEEAAPVLERREKRAQYADANRLAFRALFDAPVDVEFEGRKYRLSQETGISSQLMDIPSVFKDAQLQSERQALAEDLRKSPQRALAWFNDPQRIRLVADDVTALSSLAAALSDYSVSLAPNREATFGDAFRRMLASYPRSLADSLLRTGEARANGLAPFVTGMSGRIATPEQVRSAGARNIEMAEWLYNVAETWMPDPALDAGGVLGWLHDFTEQSAFTWKSMLRSALITAPFAAAGGPAGAALGALLSSQVNTLDEALSEQASAYADLRRQGVSVQDAHDRTKGIAWQNYALLSFTNFAEDMLTFGAGRPLTWGKRLWNMGAGALLEGAEEGGQYVITQTNTGAPVDAGEFAASVGYGIGFGLVFSGGGMALSSLIGRLTNRAEHSRSARVAMDAGARLDEAVQAARASRTLARTPELLHEFVRETGPEAAAIHTDADIEAERQRVTRETAEALAQQGALDDQEIAARAETAGAARAADMHAENDAAVAVGALVSVDAATFLQTFGPDAASTAEALGMDADELTDAAQTGGSVEVPVANLVSHPDIYAVLKDDVRHAEDGMSRNEARAFQEQSAATRQQAVAEMRDYLLEAEERGRQVEAVHAATTEEILQAGPYTRREAEKVAWVATAMVVDYARGRGVSIQEAVDELNVRYQRDTAGDAKNVQAAGYQTQEQAVPLLEQGEVRDALRARVAYLERAVADATDETTRASLQGKLGRARAMSEGTVEQKGKPISPADYAKRIEQIKADKGIADDAPVTMDDVSAARSIERKSVRDFTPEELDRAAFWETRYWTELGEKSPFYQAVNDWRANDQTPVGIVNVRFEPAPTTREETAAARARAKAASKARIQARGGKPQMFSNADTGFDIQVSRRIEAETYNHSRGKLAFVSGALENIKEIIENAVLLGAETVPASKENKKNSAFMFHFYSIVRDEATGDYYLLELLVDDVFNDRHGTMHKRAYQLKSLTGQKIDTATSAQRKLRLTPENESTSASPNADATFTVADLYRGVNAEKSKAMRMGSRAVDRYAQEGTGPDNNVNALAPRGAVTFSTAQTVVHIFEHADKSTLLHELGHVFLENRRRISLLEGAPDDMKRDWATLAKWLDIEDLDVSKGFAAMTAEERSRWHDAQEKFAAGFEKYLMEGKAPTSELARAFRAFRKWLVAIYRAVSNIRYTNAAGEDVNFELTDDVRAVMDRMLATEDAIESSRAAREAERLLNVLVENGIPDDVGEQYRDVVETALEVGRARLIKKLVEELKKEKRQELKAARDEAERRIAPEVLGRAEYRALRALQRERSDGGIRLSAEDVMAWAGGEDAGRTLMAEMPEGIFSDDGLSLEEASDLLGYGAVEEMLASLRAAKADSPQDVIAERVRQETAALDSLAHDAQALRDEAERLLHSDERMEWLALEAKMLTSAAKSAAAVIRADVDGAEAERRAAAEKRARADVLRLPKASAIAAMANAAEQAAERILAGKRLRDIQPGRFMAAEQRASNKAVEAAARGRFQEAMSWKRTELVQHALARRALEARDELRRAQQTLKRYWPERKRRRKSIGPRAFEQIIGLLNRLGVSAAVENEDRPTLRDWLADVAERRGEPTDVAEWLLDMDAGDRRTTLSSLRPEELRDVTDAVKIIANAGRLENRLLKEDRKRTFDAVVTELVNEAVRIHGEVPPAGHDPNAKRPGMFAGALATLVRVETLCRQMDGWADMGPWWDAFYRPAQDASDAELRMSKAAKDAIDALFVKHFPDRDAFQKFLNGKFDTGIWDSDGKKLWWTGENLLAAMLNWGNQHNRERLVFGNGLSVGMVKNEAAPAAGDSQRRAEFEAGRAVAEAIFQRNATEEMWDFCQDVWDYLDTFWPEIAALEERINGVAPERVKALPVQTAGGRVLRGGYYPVRFDYAALSALGDSRAKHEELDKVKALYEDQIHRPGTRHGHTKERSKHIRGAQLLLSLDVIGEHVANVIHDLTHREAVLDLYKLLNDGRVRRTMTHALGVENVKQFQPWVQSLAAPGIVTDKVDALMGKIIGNTYAVQLGLKFTSGIGQLSSIIPAWEKLGLRSVVPLFVNTISGRGVWDSDLRKRAFALSEELRQRTHQREADLRRVIEKQGENGIRRGISWVASSYFFFIDLFDSVISLVTWSTAFEKGMRDFKGDQKRAVQYADHVVRTTNNADAAKDRAQILRGGPMRKMFTMFYSPFSSVYQMFYEEKKRLGQHRNMPAVARFASFCLCMFVCQAVLEEILKGRAPWDSDDDDDKTPEAYVAWVLRNGLSTFSSMFPGVRDIAGATRWVGGTSRYRVSPVHSFGQAFVSFADNAIGGLSSLWEGEDVDTDKLLRSTFDATGYAFGLPSQQLYTWYRTFARWVEEKDFAPWELFYPPQRK